MGRSNGMLASRSKLVVVAFAVAGTLALAAPRAHAAPDRKNAEAEARDLYQKAIAHYDLAEYDRAIDEFKQAYELTNRPELLFNLAQAHRAKKDWANALHFYRTYLSRKPQAANRADVEAFIAEAEREQKAAEKSPAVQPNKTIAPVEPNKTGATVEPNKTGATDEPSKTGAIVEPNKTGATVEPNKTGAVEPTHTGAVEPNKTGATVEPNKTGAAVARVGSAAPPMIVVAPPPRPTPFLRTPRGRAVLALSVAGGAFLLTSAATGGVAVSKRGAYDASCAGGACDDGLYVTGRGLAITTDVMIGLGVAAGVTALVLYLTRPRAHPAREWSRF
ncbi:MAG TPA: hypothetical protein VFF06_11145 [Polyangia bacterium]|nr:hypothetical protein [Polyangia bacterium]